MRRRNLLPRLPRVDAIEHLLHVRDLDGALELAVKLPAGSVKRRVQRLRRKYPTATPTELVERAGATFRAQAASSSSAVGATAAAPAIGTATAVALSGAQLAAFLAASGYYVLTVAEIHGVVNTDVQRRKALLLLALLGPEDAALIQKQLGVTLLNAAREFLPGSSSAMVQMVNSKLSSWLARKLGSRALGQTMGRLLPFGVGAAVGWFGGRKLAHRVITGTAAVMGPPPLVFGAESPVGVSPGQPVTIEVEETEVFVEILEEDK